MRACNLRDAYLDGSLMASEEALFMKHLRHCHDCQDIVNEWRMFERGVKRWADAQKTPTVTAAEAHELLRRAESAKTRTRPRGRGTIMWSSLGLVGAAAAATVLLVIAPVSDPADEAQKSREAVVSSSQIAVTGLYEKMVTMNEGERLEAPSERHVVARIEKDSIALSSSGRMRLINLERGRVRLGLDAGTVACRVDKRKGDEDFVVEAGSYRVRVVGTRFSVTREGGAVSVVVQEGAVRVSGQDGRTWMLAAGDSLSEVNGAPRVEKAGPDLLAQVDNLFEEPSTAETEEGPKEVSPVEIAPAEAVIEAAAETAVEAAAEVEAESAVSAPKKERIAPVTADVATWRRWVVEGRIDDAMSAMEDYLRFKPRNRRVLALFADAARKSGAWTEAARAYEKVISLGQGAETSRSMYMLGSIYQSPLSRHRDAIKMFRAYKKSGYVSKELADLTDVKIARSLVALGKCREAETAVSHLLGRSGSFVSENARKMVERCNAEGAE